MISEVLKKIRQEFEDNLQGFLSAHPNFQRTPQTNTFNVKYYGGTPATFNEIKARIIEDVAKSETYSLYLHYPYCKYICSFCHYPVIKHTGENQNIEVIHSLIQHFSLICNEIPNLKEKKISSFYLGGGTPSLLSIENIKNLKKLLVDKISFAEDAEFTIEATPDSLTEDRINQLVDIGFNRLSIGIQILDNDTLKRLKRDHKLEQALNIIDLLKNHKELKNNIDLIYGLPGISSDKFLSDVNTLAQSGVDSMTLYRLRLGRIDERKAVLYGDYNQHSDNYSSQLENLIQIIASRKILKDCGFIEEPLGWFNKSEESNKCYNDRWLKQSPMIGLGLAAYSYGTNWQFTNKKKLDDLYDDIKNGKVPFEEGLELNREEAFLRKCAFNLRYNSHLTLSEINADYIQNVVKIIGELNSLDLGEIKDSVFSLTELGKAFIDEIIDNYFQKFKSFYSNHH